MLVFVRKCGGRLVQDHKCRDVRVKASLYYKIIGEVSPGSPNRLEVNGTWVPNLFHQEKKTRGLVQLASFEWCDSPFWASWVFLLPAISLLSGIQRYLRVQILFAAFFFGKTVRMQSCWPKEKKELKGMEVLNGKIWLGWEAEDDRKKIIYHSFEG